MSSPPFTTTAGFLARFVAPLFAGGVVEVEAPLSAHDRESMLAQASALLDPEFGALRRRCAQRLVADPALPEPGADELSLWLGLHDVLALDHPDTYRVWTRGSTWKRVENETRALLAFARPTDSAEALARHLAVGAFLELRREDQIVSGPEGELRFRGQEPPRRRLGLFSAGYSEVRSELVRWLEQPHVGAVLRLLPDVMWVSPLTALLRPGFAPPGWSPLMAADFLHQRGFARAICHSWAREREWLRVGGVVAGSLLRSLKLHREVFGDAPSTPGVPGVARLMRPGSVEGEAGSAPRGEAVAADADADADLDADLAGEEAAAEIEALGLGGGEADEGELDELMALPEPALERRPEDIGAVVAALIHLHVLKVLEFDARIGIGLGARDWAVQTFLALPLLLPALEATLGRPFDGVPDESFARRWDEYREHLAGLVPRPVVEALLATLVRRIVERQTA